MTPKCCNSGASAHLRSPMESTVPCPGDRIPQCPRGLGGCMRRSGWPMLAVLLAVAGCGGGEAGTGQQGDRDTDPLAHARALLASTPIFDGHNDLPWEIRTFAAAPMDVAAYDLTAPVPGHTNLALLKAGGVGAQFWSVYIPGEYADSGFARLQLEQIDIARRMIERYPELVLAGTADGGRGGDGGRAHRVDAGCRGWSRDRELPRGAARLLRARRALHDPHPQRDPRLGGRRAGLRAPRRPQRGSARKSCGR